MTCQAVAALHSPSCGEKPVSMRDVSRLLCAASIRQEDVKTRLPIGGCLWSGSENSGLGAKNHETSAILQGVSVSEHA